eukprot:6554354-Alexandrium_andersonii.AAC.1
MLCFCVVFVLLRCCVPRRLCQPARRSAAVSGSGTRITTTEPPRGSRARSGVPDAWGTPSEE